jgi:inhibitor of cysteine peptidase
VGQPDGRRSLIIGAAIIVVVVGSGCRTSNGPADPVEGTERDVVELVAGDAGKTVEVVEGDGFAVRLDSNPSTGYEWEVIIDDGTGDGDGAGGAGTTAVIVTDRVFAGDAGDLEGAPGTEIIRFEARSAGRSTVTLNYRRPWETDVDPIESLVFRIDVDTSD